MIGKFERLREVCSLKSQGKLDLEIVNNFMDDYFKALKATQVHIDWIGDDSIQVRYVIKDEKSVTEYRMIIDSKAGSLQYKSETKDSPPSKRFAKLDATLLFKDGKLQEAKYATEKPGLLFPQFKRFKGLLALEKKHVKEILAQFNPIALQLIYIKEKAQIQLENKSETPPVALKAPTSVPSSSHDQQSTASTSPAFFNTKTENPPEFSEGQKDKIKQLIEELQKKITRGIYPNIEKKIKEVDALSALIKEKPTTLDNAVGLSTQTNDLLKQMRREHLRACAEIKNAPTNLSPDQIIKINAVIDKLEKESFGTFANVDIKKTKIEALRALKEVAKTKGVHEAVQSIESKFPGVRAGLHSKTAALLDDLLLHSTPSSDISPS